MTNNPLELLARFDIHDDLGLALEGRAYLSPFHFEQSYGSDLVYAVRDLRNVVSSSVFDGVRKLPFEHVVALMWGEKKNGRVDRMIDFFGWTFDRWGKDADLYAWKTRNGSLVKPIEGALQVTSENGISILNIEKDYRKSASREVFKEQGPEIEGTNVALLHDFSSTEGRIELRKLLARGKYIINL